MKFKEEKPKFLFLRKENTENLRDISFEPYRIKLAKFSLILFILLTNELHYASPKKMTLMFF